MSAGIPSVVVSPAVLEYHYLNDVKAFALAVIKVTNRLFLRSILEKQPSRITKPEERLAVACLQITSVRRYFKRLRSKTATQTCEEPAADFQRSLPVKFRTSGAR